MSILETIQKEIADSLLGMEFFSNVPVLTEKKGDIAAEVEVALAKLGLVVVVELITGSVEYPGLGSTAIGLQVVFTVTENVLLNQSDNGTGKTAADCVEHIFDTFNPLQQIPLPCLCEKFDLINDVNGLLVYQVTAKAQAGWSRKVTETEG